MFRVLMLLVSFSLVVGCSGEKAKEPKLEGKGDPRLAPASPSGGGKNAPQPKAD